MISRVQGRVLIVDDNLRVLKGLKSLLGRYLYYVQTAASTEEALSEVVKDRFDTIVLDWVLPDGGSRDLIGFIRKNSPETTVIVHSAFDSSDPECTAALADGFVKKKPRTETIRYAIERGCQEALRRQRDACLCVFDLCPHDEWFTDTLLENICSASPKDDPFAIEAETEELAFSIASRIVEKNLRPRTKVYDVEHDEDYDRIMADLFGTAVCSEKTFELSHGCLDSPLPSTVIIRNANRLDKKIQDRIAFSIAEKRLQRRGSDRTLEIDVRLVVTLDAENNISEWLSDSFQALFQDYHITVPSFASIPDGGIRVLNRMINKRLGFEKKFPIGNAAKFLIETFRSQLSWVDVHIAVEKCVQNYWHKVPRVFEVEDLELPIIERSLMRKVEEETKLSSWDEFVQTSQIVYVCRVLSETGGNVAEASRISGLSRTSIYNILNEKSIDQEWFRVTSPNCLENKDEL